MICIYEKSEKEFNNLGLGALLPSSCTVKEELNGMYSLEMKHPYDQYRKWERLEEGRIILAQTPDRNEPMQPFRIYNIEPSMEEIVVKANHIFYDLLDNFVVYAESIGEKAWKYLDILVEKFEYSTPFTFSTNIQKEDFFLVKKQNPVFCLIGDAKGDKKRSESLTEKSFIGAYGGEIYRNRFHVIINEKRGEDKNVLIAYKKNLIGLKVSEDYSDVATRVYPYNSDGNGISEKFIDSPRINFYAHPKIRKLDVREGDLYSAVEEFYKGGGDLPKININVNFVELSKTEEYKNFKQLQTVEIGDLVTVFNPRMKFHKKAKIISYEYDCLLEKYNKIQLGDFISDFSRYTIDAKKENVSSLEDVYGEFENHKNNFENPHKVPTILSGAGIPKKESGRDGDIYLKLDKPLLDEKRIYIKKNGTWFGVI